MFWNMFFDWLTDFNNQFYALSLGNYVHCTFIFRFLYSWNNLEIFCTRSNWIWVFTRFIWHIDGTLTATTTTGGNKYLSLPPTRQDLTLGLFFNSRCFREGYDQAQAKTHALQTVLVISSLGAMWARWPCWDLDSLSPIEYEFYQIYLMHRWDPNSYYHNRWE